MYSLKIVFLSLFMAMITACGGGGGDSTTPVTLDPIGDLTGDWAVIDNVNATACGDGTYTDNYTLGVTQSGSSVTVTSLNAGTHTGTLSGNLLTWSGSYPDGSGTTQSSVSLTINDDCNALSGTANWTWSDSSMTCSGTSQVSASRLYPVGCGISTATVPTAPASLNAAATSSASIDLSWTDTSSDETGFRIERSTSSTTGFTEVGTVAVDVTSYTDSFGLSASTAYYYRVLATNSAGDSTPSTVVGAVTWAPSVTTPSAPTGLTATAISSSSIDLNWTQTSSDETGFRIERSTSSTTGFIAVGTVAADVTSYTDSFNLSASTTYYYRVLATNSAGDSAPSLVVGITTLALISTPTAPSSLNAYATSSTSITISWTDESTNETGFKIERSLSSSSGFVQIGTVGVGVTTYISGSLASSTTYYYRVAATNSAGSSPYSNTANATTAVDTASSAPVLTLVSNTSGDITLQWTYDNWGFFASTSEGYRLEESATSASSGFTVIYSTTNDRETPKTFTVPTRSAGTYYYRVRVYTGTSYSDYSNVLAVTVLNTVVTNTYTVTADSLLMISNQNSNIAATSYSTAENAVGCNWLYSSLTGLQDYVCAVSLLYFDVNTDISDKTIISATLKLYPAILPASYTQYEAWAIYNDWTASVTWNTMPSVYVGSGVIFDQPTSSLPSEIDVTSIVQNWANGSYSNYGFFVEDTNYSIPYATALRSTTYCSKEGVPSCTQSPQLEITYQ